MKMFRKSLWHFPVKGLGGNKMAFTTLSVNRAVLGDRRYAISAGSTKANNVNDGAWLPKAYFLQLIQTEKLAELSCQETDGNLIVHHQKKISFQGNLNFTKDAAAFLSFITNFLDSNIARPLGLHQIYDRAFADHYDPLISIGGTASLTAFAKATKTDPNPQRFRLNIILQTQTPFEENKLIGKTLQIGESFVRIVGNVGRCAAINVNPVSAYREPDHLVTMRSHFGHSNLGVFGQVTTPGIIKPSDIVQLIN